MTSTRRERRRFDELLEFIEDEIGFSTSMYNDRYLDRRILARMRRTGTDSYRDYLSELRSAADEQEALADALSINVTGFFRNVEVWRELADILERLAGDTHGTVRLWSAACSDGREPYSMAMLVHSIEGLWPSKFEIVATDIKPSVLQTAREGVYESTGTDDALGQLDQMDGMDDYVERDGDRLRVVDSVRKMVAFRRHDLIRDPPPSDFDLVMCRNLLIYIDSESKREIFDTLTSGLNDGGCLVVGKTETLPSGLSGAYDAVDNRLRVYQHRAD